MRTFRFEFHLNGEHIASANGHTVQDAKGALAAAGVDIPAGYAIRAFEESPHACALPITPDGGITISADNTGNLTWKAPDGTQL